MTSLTAQITSVYSIYVLQVSLTIASARFHLVPVVLAGGIGDPFHASAQSNRSATSGAAPSIIAAHAGSVSPGASDRPARTVAVHEPLKDVTLAGGDAAFLLSRSSKPICRENHEPVSQRYRSPSRFYHTNLSGGGRRGLVIRSLAMRPTV
jgi:hypothetical protein